MSDGASFGLALPFDTDDTEFVRGFEAGRLWEQLKSGEAVEVADGGPTEPGNLETLCADCHVLHHQAEVEAAKASARAERQRGLVAA